MGLITYHLKSTLHFTSHLKKNDFILNNYLRVQNIAGETGRSEIKAVAIYLITKIILSRATPFSDTISTIHSPLFLGEIS
ncbi:MAG: hypothetical protein PVI90_18780, partial [Desulfobacteraceae bacterium]